MNGEFDKEEELSMKQLLQCHLLLNDIVCTAHPIVLSCSRPHLLEIK